MSELFVLIGGKKMKQLKATSKNLFYVSRQLNSSNTRQIEGAYPALRD
jgi:hypothetical protein